MKMRHESILKKVSPKESKRTNAILHYETIAVVRGHLTLRLLKTDLHEGIENTHAVSLSPANLFGCLIEAFIVIILASRSRHPKREGLERRKRRNHQNTDPALSTFQPPKQNFSSVRSLQEVPVRLGQLLVIIWLECKPTLFV
jgi:hypothetical protein